MEAPGDVPNQQNMKMDKKWVISLVLIGLFICIFCIALPVVNVMNKSNHIQITGGDANVIGGGTPGIPPRLIVFLPTLETHIHLFKNLCE